MSVVRNEKAYDGPRAWRVLGLLCFLWPVPALSIAQVPPVPPVPPAPAASPAPPPRP